MAMGRPVLATPQALEGIGARADEDVMQAASPPEWADRLVRLLGDADLRGRLAENGRRYVQTHHSWTACLEPLGDLLACAKALTRPGRGPARVQDYRLRASGYRA